MRFSAVKLSVNAVLPAGLLLLSAVWSGAAGAAQLLNSSYDIARELFTEINPLFEKQWNAEHPDDPLTIRQSHGGSSKQALAILQGLRADVVTYNQVTDVQVLHDKGNLLAADWQARLPNNSSPYYSTMAFLVRKGNPKQIKDWDSLLRDDVKIVFPNPKTSGNGRYTYLAAEGFWQQKNGKNSAKTQEQMKKFLSNVAVFDTGGRGATTSFIDRGLGDVLISFESEVNNIRNEYGADDYDVIVPASNILAEFPVARVDKNAEKNGTQAVADAYLTFLYSPAAQAKMAQFNYRVTAPDVMAANKGHFPPVTLFKVEDQFGSWSEVMTSRFNSGGEFDTLMAQGR
ncbi:TPA: thiosulfate ABC transporter substrate-binding protein CysP [Morganella morganii]|uniref:thiosulfate ABC transporter substrate-binding protein CysP n=1 Tax=Morganella morganii TaxID=582 RepID=UPI0029C5B1FC|nr:thiosulfate ABC transporter substrate-binding protein CysP [Morganella morganii]